MHEVTITTISTHRYLIDAADPVAAEEEAQRRLLAGDDGDKHRLYREVESISSAPHRDDPR